MRAITGVILSSKPCSLAKAARILDLFADSAASNLPSSDAATYLHTAADATKNHHRFRLDLLNYYHRGDTAASASASASASDKKKRKRSEDHHQAATHVKQEQEVQQVAYATDLVAQDETDKKTSKKNRKKKKHESQQENARDVKQIVGAPEQRFASPEKKRNKKNHPEEEEVKTVVKGIIVSAGDSVATEKKRKKKRERGDDTDNDKEQVEHTRKKPRNRS